MADVNYENIPSIIGIYEGTVAQFEDITDKSNFYGRLILITGTDADKNQAMWTSEDDGTNAHYLNMSDVATLKAQLAHIDGIAFPRDGGSSTLYDKYDLTGGKGFIFKGSNGITVKINPSTSTTIDSKPYWSIEVNGQTLKADLIGTTSNGSNTSNHPDTIRGAKAYADSLYVDLKGTKAEGDTTAQTIEGAKDYADKVAASEASAAKAEAIQESMSYVDDELVNKADLENGKIPVGQLPDYILGQMLFGGTIEGGTQTQMIVDPSDNLMNKIGKTDADLNADGYLVITNTSYKPYEGVYFISSINFDNVNVVNIPDVRVGDWIISTGTSWRKIDNTDAVSSVAGLTGVITVSDLAGKLASSEDNANELALKSEVDAKYTKPAQGIPEGDLTTEVQAALAKANTAITSLKGSDYITVGREAGGTIQQQVVTANTAEITSETDTTNGLATVADIRSYLKARLSVKVVS